MPRRSPVPPGGDPQKHPALSGGHVIILSGEKPIYKQNMQGPQGHAALGQILEQRGFEYEPCHGKYNGAKQPGYIVHVRNDGEDEQLKGIAKRMGQEAIVHSEGNQHQYIYTGGDDEGRATPPSSGLQWFGDQEPDDNYTTLYGPDGEPLGHFSYILDFGQPLVQHGPGQFVDVPEAARAVLKAAVETYHGILLDLRKREDMAKYVVEQKRAVTHGPKPVSDDISAQSKMQPSNPHSGNIVSKGEEKPGRKCSCGGKPVDGAGQPKGTSTMCARCAAAADATIERLGREDGSSTKKSEADDRARIRAVRDAEDRELAAIPLRDPNKYATPTPTGPVPNVGELTRKTETDTMKLHDLLKSQAQGSSLKKAETPGQGEHGGSPKRPNFPEPKPVQKAQCTCGKDGCQWCKPVKKSGFPATNKFSNKLAAGRAPAPAAGPDPKTSPAAAGAKEAFTQRAGPAAAAGAFGKGEPAANGGQVVVKNSIFKKMPDMGKAETNASISARRNGGHIKLGKQEFYIDLKNASDSKKRLKETNPVESAYVPGGKETGWETGGRKPKEVSAGDGTGGAISKNPPKPGPDQKNTAENSVTEGNPGKQKSPPKNDLIEKAAANWHKRNPNGGLAKAAAAMAAPPTPKAPGSGSPKLQAKPPTKPPTAAPGGKPMGKSITPMSGAAAAHDAAAGRIPPPAAEAPKATPRPASDYDPTLFAPQGPVSSGLELAGPPAGMRSRSPAVHRGIRMAPMGKGEQKPAEKPRIVNGQPRTKEQDALDVMTQADDVNSARTQEKMRTVMSKAELCKACGKDHALTKKCGA